MVRQLSFLVGSALLVSTLFLAAADAHGPGGGGGGARGGYHYGGYYYPNHGYGSYGPYRAGLYAPYGFYRPYYGGFFGPGLAFGSGLGLGMGLGYGLGGYGMGGYGLGGYGLGGYGGYLPYYGGAGGMAAGMAMAPPAAPGGVAAPPGAPPVGGGGEPPLAPSPDNAAHLQLVVPPNAEVLFEGSKTTQSGATREFVSPKLPAGKLFDYTITVRYTDANGKAVTDKRVIHVRANDWFRIDFTRPAPPEPLPSVP